MASDEDFKNLLSAVGKLKAENERLNFDLRRKDRELNRLRDCLGAEEIERLKREINSLRGDLRNKDDRAKEIISLHAMKRRIQKLLDNFAESGADAVPIANLVTAFLGAREYKQVEFRRDFMGHGSHIYDPEVSNDCH